MFVRVHRVQDIEGLNIFPGDNVDDAPPSVSRETSLVIERT